MDKQMSARFDRIAKALNTLIDSISKYNPAINQGAELVIADTELSKGLDELHIHQQNYARIQQLRGITTSLDNQIKDTLIQLAQTRKELVGTPATIYPDGPNYPIKYAELLPYARRISKTTLPHQSVLAAAQANSQPATNSVPKPDSGTGTAATTPGAGTPNGANTGSGTGIATATSTPAAIVGHGPGGATPAQNGEPAFPSQQTNTSMPENLSAHMNPLDGVDFIPWPTEDHIRQGSLANLAYLANRGIEPEGYDPAAEDARKKREEEEAKEREELERRQREENERKLREQRERERLQREKEMEEAYRSASASQGGSADATSARPPSTVAAPEKKQFQFMGGDDDDDDSD